LPILQQRIVQLVFLDGLSHLECYESIRTQDAPSLTFHGFLVELRSTYQAMRRCLRGSVASETAEELLPNEALPVDRRVASAELRARLEQVLMILTPDQRVAVKMYVIDGVPAADVAHVLGLGNAKAVYNMVYRALGAMREELLRAGIGPGDL
jgi:DNA-directed RNA polymerase specialized sigma24 family protein